MIANDWNMELDTEDDEGFEEPHRGPNRKAKKEELYAPVAPKRKRCPNLEKCRFMLREVKYLGYTISEKGTEPSVEKTEVVRKFQSPKNAKEIKQLLGLTGYFRDFIEGYLKLLTPLTNLLKKNIPYNWTDT